MGDEASDSVFTSILENYTEAKNLQKKVTDELADAALQRTTRATELLEEAVAKVDGLLTSSPESAKLLGMKCSLLYEQAKVQASAGHELEARKVLSGALELAQPSGTEPEVIYVMFRVINHLSYLFVKDGELEKPRTMLEQAAGFYAQFKERDPLPEVFIGDDLFQQSTPAEGSLEKLERLVTNNFQMLAFVRNKQGDLDSFVRCHHLVLRRQLELCDADPPLWATKVLRLASVFLDGGQLDDARHHLAAVSVVLNFFEETLDDEADRQHASARWKEFAKVSADLAKGWVKYSMCLFVASRDRMRLHDSANPFLHMCSPETSLDVIPEEEAAVPKDETRVESGEAENKPVEGELACDEETKTEVEGEETTTSMESESLPEREQLFTESAEECKDPGVNDGEEAHPLRFPSLQLDAFESGVPSTYVESSEQARALFRFAHVWLRHSAKYYNLRDRPNEHVDVVIELSELYRHLAFFEDDLSCQHDVQRRRADTLEALCMLVRELRPQCYVAVGVELLWELTEVQLDLLGLEFRGLFGTADDGCGDFTQLLDTPPGAVAHPAFPGGYCFGSYPESTAVLDLRPPENQADFRPISGGNRYFTHQGDYDTTEVASEDTAPLDGLEETTETAETQLDYLAKLDVAPDFCPLFREPETSASHIEEQLDKNSTTVASSQGVGKLEDRIETVSTCSAESEKSSPRDAGVTPPVA
ncbi:hypothetical protein PR048_022023 [Dryococelus australis]|uniref:KIF-binding protein n=1 Tax=Dryococelus australis TaxID=614101 RepID=A0ABQ9H019_9NEOP|nr:hypothetical protein PR048_022023 [Dryococelus australis]